MTTAALLQKIYIFTLKMRHKEEVVLPRQHGGTPRSGHVSRAHAVASLRPHGVALPSSTRTSGLGQMSHLQERKNVWRVDNDIDVCVAGESHLNAAIMLLNSALLQVQQLQLDL